MPGTTPIESGTELDYLLRCVADGLATLATTGYGTGDRDRGGRVARKIECEPFNGRFTVDELKKAALQSPGMRVSITGITKVSHVGDGDVDLTLEFGAAIVTQAKSLAWDGLAARTLQAVVAGMNWQNWGTYQGRTPFLHPRIEGCRSQNLFGDITVKAGATVWAITWQQQARVPATAIVATQDDAPANLYVKGCPPYGPPPLRTPPDRFTGTDRATAEAARDMVFSNDPAALAQFDANADLGIILSWTVGDQACQICQVRQENAWVDFRTHVYTQVDTLSDWPA